MSQALLVIVAAGEAAVRKARIATLTRVGARVQEAASEAEILALVVQQSPDVVLLDIDLAGEDGIEVSRRLRSSTAFTAPLVLCMTASATALRKQAAFEEAADAHIVEPAEPGALLAVVRSMSRLAGTRHELSRAAQRNQRLELQLRESQAEVEQFAVQACHDIEEPIRAVTTFAQLMEERREAGLSMDERTYLGHVLAASSRLRRLVRSILAYSRAGRRQQTDFGPVDLRIAASAAISSLRSRLEDTGTAIQLAQSLPSVRGDFGELQQVFEQVIGNAIDYRRPGSAVTVSVGAKPAGEEWVVAIEDNGDGIAAEFQSSIFLPFKRLHGREIPGAGMGLAISRKIVEAHGGRMWVESRPGSGASFFFSLRALEADAKAS